LLYLLILVALLCILAAPGLIETANIPALRPFGGKVLQESIRIAYIVVAFVDTSQPNDRIHFAARRCDRRIQRRVFAGPVWIVR